MAVLHLGGVIINEDYKGAILDALYADELRLYLKNKYEWSEDSFKTIGWNSLDGSLTKVRGLHRITVYKLLHFWQPTGKYLRRNEGCALHTGTCLQFDKDDDQRHYMSCRSAYFKEARPFAWKQVCAAMKRYAQEETLLRAIWIGIQNFVCKDFDEAHPKDDDLSLVEYEALKKVFLEQNVIGWNHFLAGRIATGWNQFFALRVSAKENANGLVMAFGRSLVASLWSYTLQVWKRHNECVYGDATGFSRQDEEAFASVSMRYILIFKDWCQPKMSGCLKQVSEEGLASLPLR